MNINKRQFDILVRKAQAHDDYLSALRVVTHRRATLPLRPDSDIVRGYDRCLNDFGDAIEQIMRDRLVAGGQ